MDSEGSVPYQKVPAAGLYCEVRKPSQHRQNLLLEHRLYFKPLIHVFRFSD